MKFKNLNLKMFFILVALVFLVSSVSAMQNPAAIYCKEMGYKYSLANGSTGQIGFCTLPDKTTCNEWDFFNGNCGAKYSYCSKKGYSFKLIKNDSDPLLKEVPSCLIPDDKKSKFFWIFKIKQGYNESSVISIMNLTGAIIGKVNTNKAITSSSIKSVSLTTPTILSLPASFDWRNYNSSNWMTPVRNQGSCGACYVFSTLGATEAKYKININNFSFNPDLAEQQYISCTQNGETCESGGWAGNVASYLVNVGIVNEASYPYVEAKSSCNLPANYSSQVHKIITYQSFSADSDLLKNTIMNNGPVIASIPSWWHSVVLVGWDNSGNFIFKNSWGSTWNGNGYGTISFSLLDNSSFVLVNKTDFDSDNTDDSLDLCLNDSGSYCNGCSKPVCQSGYYPSCFSWLKPTCERRFEISNWTSLNAIRNNPNNFYILIKNLSSSSSDYTGIGNNWQPIGGFTGSFDGNGNTISDIVVGGNLMYSGLFTFFTEPNTTILNLGIINATFNVTNSNLIVGSIVGYNGATIKNSYFQGLSKSIGSTGAHGYHGGLVGSNTGNISDSYFSGTIISTESHLGGIVGSSGGNIINSYSVGSINTSSYDAGGIAGYNSGNVTNSYSTMKMNIGTYIGGLVGENSGNVLNSGWWTGSGPKNAIGNPARNITYNEADKTVFYNKSHGVYTSNYPVWNFVSPIWYEWDNDYPNLFKQPQDVSPPIITLISPLDNSNTSNLTLIFNYSVEDRSLINNCQLIFDSYSVNSSNSLQTGIFYFVYTATIGNHNWSVRCVDKYNNTGNSNNWKIFIQGPQQTNNLIIGWNSIIFNVLPEDKSLQNVLSSINGEYSQIKTQDSEGNILMWDESMPDFANDLTTINFNQTYLINMKQNATITVEGAYS